MAFFRKSLAEDSIDRYGHTWAFVFLLLLSITTLFVSLSPSVTLTKSHSSFPLSETSTSKNQGGVTTKPPVSNRIYPEYKATCWMPNEFDLNKAVYTNSVCASALNSLVQRKNSSKATLYKAFEDIPFRNPLSTEDINKPILSSKDSDGSDDQDERRNEIQRKHEDFQREQDKVHSGIQDLLIYMTPVFLFICAICLRLPHAVWSLLSSCFGCINVDQTLAHAQTVQSLATSNRNRLTEDISMSLQKCTKRTTGILYLLMKLLMVVGLCCLIIINYHCLLLETVKLDDDVGFVQGLSEDLDVLRLRVKESKQDSENPEQDSKNLDDLTSSIYLCQFKMTSLQNVQTYGVQCVFSQNFESMIATKDDSTFLKGQHSYSESPERRIVLVYKALFTIVLALLVILVLINIISLLVWFMKLMLPSYRSRMGLNSDASLDVTFIVSMAWCNTSALIATELTRCSPYGCADHSDKEGESSRLKQDMGDN